MDNFDKALRNLREGLALFARTDRSVLTLTGLVSLFEICFEQAWKRMKTVLYREGFLEANSGSPTRIIKLSYRERMIQDEASWRAMLDQRRMGVHAYKEEVAEDIAASVPAYIELFENLQKELEANWTGAARLE